MTKYDITLRPIRYACVSGGKDSLYMLGYILQHLDIYPLDYVVHYELEIDWSWTKAVVDKMEAMCKVAGIPFIRIKPRKSWIELYNKYDMPTRRARWCNSDYKLDAEKQMVKWIESQNCRPIAYIGFCADETRRFKYALGNWEKEMYCYPLAEEGITEDVVLAWARKNPIFSDWYKYFTRQGCMMCPMLTRKELAYMCKYEHESFEKYFEYVSAYEQKYNTYFWDKPCWQIRKVIENKWLDILNSEEQFEQLSVFDFLDVEPSHE